MKELIEQGGVPVKLWVDSVEVEPEAMQQIRNVASLPVVGPHVAIMPDVHWGVGATVGSVIPTRAAIIPAAVGVDLGCGMMAVRTDLSVNDLAGNLAVIRDAIERAIPVGGPGIKGSWDQRGTTPGRVLTVWEKEFDATFARIQAKHPKIRQQPTVTQLGTLGTGNHFIEVCQDLEDGGIWFMLHSGSRGVGNRIGTYFIEQAKTGSQSGVGVIADGRATPARPACAREGGATHGVTHLQSPSKAAAPAVPRCGRTRPATRYAPVEAAHSLREGERPQPEHFRDDGYGRPAARFPGPLLRDGCVARPSPG